MALIDTFRQQYAVYWPPINIDIEGQETYGEPVELSPLVQNDYGTLDGVRWEDLSEEYTDYKGNTVISKSKVYVGRPLVEGGMMAKGKLSEQVNPDSPVGNRAFRISKTGELPDRRAVKFLRWVYL